MAPLPVTNESQTTFAAFLSQSVSAETVCSYLSAIRFYQIRAGLLDPSLSPPPRLPYVLKGIQRSRQSQSSARKKHLPVTPELLMKIHTFWSQRPLTFECCGHSMRHHDTTDIQINNRKLLVWGSVVQHALAEHSALLGMSNIHSPGGYAACSMHPLAIQRTFTQLDVACRATDLNGTLSR